MALKNAGTVVMLLVEFRPKGMHVCTYALVTIIIAYAYYVHVISCAQSVCLCLCRWASHAAWYPLPQTFHTSRRIGRTLRRRLLPAP